MQNKLSPLFLLPLFGFTSLLHAEVIEKTDTTETTLSPITVTATRTEQETNLVSTTVIKRADIERLQANSVEDALRGVAGINFTNEGGVGKNSSVFLRGTESSHLIVMVDGIRMGSITDGRTAFQDLPISEIDNIEVIRGAKSSLYGSEAIGGVIHIHTRQGAEKALKPSFSVSAGSHNRYRYSGGVSGKVAKTWYNLNLTHEQTQGFDAKSAGTTPDNDGFNNNSGSVRIGHQITDKLLVEGNFLYAAGHNEYDITPHPIFAGGDEFAKNNYVQQVVGGQIKYKAADFWTMTFKAGESRDIYNDKSISPSRYETHRFSLTAQNDFTLAKGHLLTVGYDYLADELKSSTQFNQSKRDDHAVFTQYQGSYENHSVLAGFRHDENQQFGGYNTWNVAYGYQFFKDFNFSASYGTAFKAPTFNQTYAPAAWQANPNLKPESSRNYEVSLKGKHDWGRWEINHYGTYIKNLIVYPAWPGLAENISQARIRGVELIGETQVYGFNVRGNLSLLNPENREYGANGGKVLNRRAEQVFRLDVDKRIDNFSAGATVIAEGRRFDDVANTQRVGGFATLDLRAEYTLLKQLTLQAKVNNILNKQYQTVKGYNTDDLNVFFTLRYVPNI